jgi:hypothetical protein
MTRITRALTGALAALAFSAATAHADSGFPGSPTSLDWGFNVADDYSNPLFSSVETWDQNFSVTSDPSEMFEGAVQREFGVHCCDNYNVTVEQDISGNVPVGEQYNDFTFLYVPYVLGEWGLVYNDIGITPEAFLTTPFGDIDFPTAFVEAVGPTFFEPWAMYG